jgi:hypothetical protein
LVWGNITVTKTGDTLACNLLATGPTINPQEVCYECDTACDIPALHEYITLAGTRLLNCFVIRIIILPNTNSERKKLFLL